MMEEERMEESVSNDGLLDSNEASDDNAQEAAQEKPRVAIPILIRDLCMHARSDFSTCDACLENCPMDAISFTDGVPFIEADFCLSCELCCGVCPTGAWTSTRVPLPELRLKIEKTARLFDVGYVTCSQARARKLSASIAEVPCLGMIPPELWFACITTYPNLQVYLPVGLCDDCPIQNGEELMVDAISQAEVWSHQTVGLEVDKENLDFMILKTAAERVDRRGLFTNIAKTARNTLRAQSMPEVVEEFMLQKTRMRSVLGSLKAADKDRDEALADARAGGYVRTDRRCLVETRRMIYDTILQHPEYAEGILIKNSITNEECDGCGLCAQACPTGARKIRNAHADVEPIYCVGCGLCEETCAKEACRVIQTPATILLENNARLSNQ